MLVLKNARLIPELTEGFDGTCADIVIDGGVIEEIRSAGSLSASSAQTIDLSGKTLIPGLICIWICAGRILLKKIQNRILTVLCAV